MRHNNNRLSVRLLVVSLLGAFISQTCLAELKLGDDFPDLASFNLEGKLPEAIKGKVVLVDFWASWCGPCRLSFPVMNELQKKYSDKGFVIIAISVDELRAKMDKFLKQTPASFTIVRDATQKLVEKVDVRTMPTSFLIDRQGKVRYMHSGFNGEETRKAYESEIESLLKP